MKPVLVKKAQLPSIYEMGISPEEIKALRWIKEKHEPTANKTARLRDNLSNVNWENRLIAEGLHTIPGFQEGKNPSLSFVNPASKYGALQGDVGYHAAKEPSTLIGFTEPPNWWRTPQMGAANLNLAGEGVRYGGYPKAYKIPVKHSPIDAQDFLLDMSRLQLQGMSADEAMQSLEMKTPQFESVFDLQSQLPPVKTENIWGEPGVIHGNPDLDFDLSQYKVASEPMDIAMRLLKEESQGQLYNEDLFEGFLGADDLIHYDEMNDKQRAIIDAKMALPPHLFTEGSEMGEYMNPFLFSRSMYNKIPDYHYDDELEYLQHYKDAMESGNFVNDNEKTRLLDGNESHPEHPHSVAMSRMHPDFKNRIGTINRLYKASEPMDIAMRLLKMPQEAKDYANQIHEGQMYGEQPYMNHVEDVASGFDDPHLQRIAYLHDTIEDSETGIGEIHERFGEDVGHAVDALTRRQGEQYFDYINRVKQHPEATQVKLADLHSNLKNNPNESLAKRYQKAIGILTNKSEPMDIAFQLLKAYDVEEVKRKLMDGGSYEDYVDYQIADAQPGMDRTLPRPYGLMNHQALNRLQHGWFEGDIRDMLEDPNFAFERDDEGRPIWSGHNLGWGNPEHADPEHIGFMIENQLEGTPVDFEEMGREVNLRDLENVPFELNEPQSASFLGMKVNPTSTTQFSTHSAHGPTDTLEEIEGMKGRGFQDIHTGEPMEIAMQLLKERVSPEAKRHKLEYDKKYESSPERVKYREDLNRERRRRGIYGSHDHKDISHTEGGKLTLEGEHENRARHFKDKGTLREL